MSRCTDTPPEYTSTSQEEGQQKGVLLLFNDAAVGKLGYNWNNKLTNNIQGFPETSNDVLFNVVTGFTLIS